MESITIPEVRSTNSFNDEFQKLHLAPENDNGSSFTALLELPSNQAMELLTDDFHADVVKRHRISAFNNSTLSSRPPAFPSNRALIERAAKYSVFANDDSVELKVKSEPLDSGSNPNSSDPMAGSESDKEKPLKRKEREKKGKGSSKKNKTTSDDGEKLPYVHVRARRGQATDSHSLAERARREKINARMKLLQELVPGCNKISGTAMVLDEIINHVQWLQRQVEHLSMRLAAVNPKIDFNLDSLISGTESMMECNYPNMAMPIMWPEIHVNGDRQQIQPQSYLESSSQPEIHVNGDRQQIQPQSYLQSSSQPVWVKEENQCNLVASENSLMTFDLPPNSASLHTNQLKMEL